MLNNNKTLVVGSRGSLLAQTQTQWVIDRIQAAHADLEITTQIITTKGDRLQSKPLPEIGGKGLFTEELEEALLAGSVDLAVHSAKDLPTELREGLDILAYPIREDPRDAWISANGTAFDDLPPGSVIGTTSLRRQAQLLLRRRDISFVGLRGNVDTRIKKILRGDCSGAVLAMAGLKRVALDHHVTHPFEPEVMLPAPGQGALAIEGRGSDERVRDLLQAIHDEPTALTVNCERAILHELDAGCRAPVGILAQLKDTDLHIEAFVSDPQGKQCIRVCKQGLKDDPDSVIRDIADDLKSQGADAIIAACR